MTIRLQTFTQMALWALMFSGNIYQAEAQTLPQTVEDTPLELSATQGDAPFTVETLNTGRDGDCVNISRFNGHGIAVSWGDGATAPNPTLPPPSTDEPCPPFGVYTYTVPGTYTVRVAHWTVGADDGSIPLGTQTATITVTGKPVFQETKLSLKNVLESTDNYTIPYAARVFYIGHSPSEEFTLTTSLRLMDGTELATSQREGIAHQGTTAVFFDMSEARRNATAKALAGREDIPAQLVLSGKNTEGRLIALEHIDLKLSALMPQRTRQCPYRDKTLSPGEELVIKRKYSAARTLAYELVWGDGHTETDTKPAWKFKDTLRGADERHLTLKHVYEDPGIYDFTLRFENARHTSTVEDIIGICKIQVTVN